MNNLLKKQKNIKYKDFSLKKYDKVSVCSCDSGASRHIAKWLKDIDQKISYCLRGPAIEIFKNEFPIKNNISLKDCIENSNVLITGTGWSSDLEISAIKLAKENSIHVISVLDHWINYKERFFYKNEYILPDQIWVSDKLAEKLAIQEFPNIPIELLPNIWMENIKFSVKSLRSKYPRNSPGLNIVYFLEPIRKQWSSKYKESGEFIAIRYFFDNLHIIQKLNNINNSELLNLRFRLHPSENKEKSITFIDDFELLFDVYFSESSSLEEDLAWADIAFGIETQALVVAMECGIRAFSTKPKWAGKSLLPHDDLIHLSEIID